MIAILSYIYSPHVAKILRKTESYPNADRTKSQLRLTHIIQRNKGFGLYAAEIPTVNKELATFGIHFKADTGPAESRLNPELGTGQ